jgi:hypothetical protein
MALKDKDAKRMTRRQPLRNYAVVATAEGARRTWPPLRKGPRQPPGLGEKTRDRRGPSGELEATIKANAD